MGSFTAENFINAIGGPDKLTEICIDKGGNFLSGKVTSGFQKVMTAETKTYTVITKFEGMKDIKKTFTEKDQAENYKAAQEEDYRKGEDSAKAKGREVKKWSVEIQEGTMKNAPANITGVAANTLGMMGALPIAPEMISGIINEATNVVADKLTSTTAKITEVPIKAALQMPKKIKEKMQETFDKEKTSLSKEMERFTTNAEDRLEKQREEDEKEADRIQKSKLSSQLASLNKCMTKVTDQINKKVGSISKYASEGPDWCAAQISNALDSQMSILDQQVENTCNDITKGVNEYAEGIGISMGHKMAEKYNKIIEDQAKRTYNMIQENKSKASIKAFTALQKAKLKIMSLTGINIPV